MSLEGTKKGDTVYVVYGSPGARAYRAHEAKVVSVGPKWVTTRERQRFRRDTGAGDFGWRCYASKAAYDESVERSAVWSELRDVVHCGTAQRAAHLTTERLREITAELRGQTTP